MGMKRWFVLSTVVLSMVILLTPFTPQAASPTAATAVAEKPQYGGIYKVILRTPTNIFGYPPRLAGASKDYAQPFFDRLLSVGDDGKYKPGLALSWDTSKDGKTIMFKLRQGVTFHDGTPFNAQAVKANLDNLIPPKENRIVGITSVDVVDDHTVRINLSSYNNLILYHLAVNPITFMYSPEALKKNGADWALTHPVGTGPFMLKDYQPDVSITAVKNPNYWQKGLPYLDGIAMTMVSDPMTQMLTFKAGQVNAIYSAQEATAQLRDEGYIMQKGLGTGQTLTFDTKNSEYFSKRQVREAIEYAIDKEAICNGPGQGIYMPWYQIVPNDSPDYNKACPPRKYDPAKAKKLLAEAGYPNGFSFKVFVPSTVWKDGWVAAQSYLNAVGIKMDINYLNVAAMNVIRMSGKIEKGAAAYQGHDVATNILMTLDSFWRSNVTYHEYVVKPAGIDKLIDQVTSSRDPAAIAKITKQIIKLLYDDETVVPLWHYPRIAFVDKSVRNTGWFIHNDNMISEFGTRTWLKK
jgi:peptide/nickel transport system substrate-binding protein